MPYNRAQAIREGWDIHESELNLRYSLVEKEV